MDFIKEQTGSNYETILKEYEEYKRIYDELVKLLKLHEYDEAIKIIDEYIEGNKYKKNFFGNSNIFKSRIVEDDYYKVRFISYLIYVKAIIISNNDKEKSLELLYLSYYITHKYLTKFEPRQLFVGGATGIWSGHDSGYELFIEYFMIEQQYLENKWLLVMTVDKLYIERFS